MLAIRVMQSEGLLDKGLLNFLVNGPQRMPQDLTSVQYHQIYGGADRVDRGSSQASLKGRRAAAFNSMVWADLQALAKIRPFNNANLLEHISGHAAAWKSF